MRTSPGMASTSSLVYFTDYFSVLSGCIVLPYLSYAIPVICLLIKGRDKIQPGPFWVGTYGLVSNIVLLGWALFTFVM